MQATGTGLTENVKTEMKIKTCGRETSCDLVLEHSTVSRLHARFELAADGLVNVLDSDSRNGTFLNRNDRWIRIRKVTLCIGDRIRFGDIEIPLERLTMVFGHRANARLEAKHFPFRPGNKNALLNARKTDHGPVMQKPRRNPKTGKIEEERAGKAG
jgi:pSer/pThr/pTyr-binding forkhead associated (FHA) protein